jgi:Arc/MetJ-type ribon-helix-helix transcriptional regulator
MKVISLRLNDNLVDRIDAVAKNGFVNRSDALRYLVESGLDHDALAVRIQELESKFDRALHVIEMLYQLTYINTVIGVDGRDDLKLKLPAIKTKANEELVSSLIKKFGE